MYILALMNLTKWHYLVNTCLLMLRKYGTWSLKFYSIFEYVDKASRDVTYVYGSELQKGKKSDWLLKPWKSKGARRPNLGILSSFWYQLSDITPSIPRIVSIPPNLSTGICVPLKNSLRLAGYSTQEVYNISENLYLIKRWIFG